MSKANKKTPKGKVGKTLHLVSTMLVGILLCANVAVILVLITCGLCSFISPTDYPRLGLFCLFYPLFVVVNLAFIPVWLLVRWRLTIVPAVGLLLSTVFTQSYCPVHFPSADNPSDDARLLRVMTFNSHYFRGLDDADSSYTFLQLLRRDTFDIIAIQEGDYEKRNKKKLEPFMASHGYICIESKAGNWIYTRLKHIDTAPIEINTLGGNNAVVYRLGLDGDTLVVVNVHLESFRLGEPAIDQYHDLLHNFNPDSTRSTGRVMVNLMQPKMKFHGEQIDSVMKVIEPLVANDEMLILCGDFNDSPVSYVCRRARTVLADAYREAGWGTGFTYHEKAMPFRIDHIFASRRLKPIKTWVESSVLESDHYPLATILEVLPKKEKGENR